MCYTLEKQITTENSFSKVYHEREKIDQKHVGSTFIVEKKRMERNDWTSNRLGQGSELELEDKLSKIKGDGYSLPDMIFQKCI